MPDGVAGMILMKGLEALLSYLISLAASLRATAIDEGRTKKLQEQLDAESAFFENFESTRPLREEIDRVGINIGRICSYLGADAEEYRLFLLLQDPVFIDDLANWILAEDRETEAKLTATLSEHFLRELQRDDPTPDEVSEFTQRFLDLVEKQVFSNPLLNNWRNALRTRALQAEVAAEGQSTRDSIKTGTKEVVEAVKSHVGPLIQTTADDIRKLRKGSEDNVNSILSLAEVNIDGHEVKVERNVAQALNGACDHGSLLVVGEPGAGKSIVLCDVAISKRRDGFESIFLDVQRLQSESLGGLRDELGLAHEIVEVFADWPGRDSAFLFIDALDAARSDPAGRMIRDLIIEIGKLERWTVVAAVRKFDLRYADDIKGVFRGEPANIDFCDREFLNLRHLNVSLFDDAELADVSRQSSTLGKLLGSASDVLRDLLRVPFNVRLAGEILVSGTGLIELAPIRTQLELLDSYWQARVIRSDPNGDARESVAFQAASAMVENRSLTISRLQLSGNPSASEPLQDLLSTNVLAEWVPPGLVHPDRYTLAFSHNILFDFAAEKALFRGQPNELIDKLASEPDLVLAIRPSAAFLFQRLWLESPSRDRFWDTALAAANNSQVPKISQLIGPTIAVEFAQDISDFDRLFSAIEGSDAQRKEAAAVLVQHIAGTLLADDMMLVGESAGPWVQWMERVCVSLDDRTAIAIRNLLRRCLDE